MKRTRRIFWVIVLLWAASPSAAITFDSATSISGNASALSFDHVVSGSNRLLLVTVGINSPSAVVSGVRLLTEGTATETIGVTEAVAGERI